MNQAVFKIRNGAGKFSTGGTSPNWTNRGKTWNGLGAVKSHLRQFIIHFERDKKWENNIPEDWEVIESNFNTGKQITYPARTMYPIDIYGAVMPPRKYGANRKKYIHINQFNIRSNIKHNTILPVITIKQGETNTYCNEVEILGPSKITYCGPGDITPLLSCGARVVIETESNINIIK